MEQAPPGLAGTTEFWTRVKLLSDGSATGDFTCIDLLGSDAPGNISGKVTSWSMEGTVIVLNIIGTVVPIPDGPPFDPYPVSFTVKIQKFGGAGVGRWTLQDSDPPSVDPFGTPGFIFCYELLTSGQIVYRPRGKTGREDDD